MTMKSMLKDTQTKAEAALKAAQARDAKSLVIAEWFDAKVGPDVPLPKYVHMSRLYGAEANLSFDELTPAGLLALLAAFPPVEVGAYRGSCATLMPKQYFESSEKAQRDYNDRRDGGHILMQVSRTSPSYPTDVSIEWWSPYGDHTIQFSAKLDKAYDIYLPGLDAEVRYHRDVVIEVKNTTLQWPTTATPLGTLMSYGAGDKTCFPSKVLGGDTLKYLQWIHSTSEAAAQQLRDALQYDIDNGVVMVDAGASYESSGRLRPGTKEQHDALNTLEARTDQTLAKRHWKAYCEKYGLETKQGYYCHFTWASNWLAKHGLNPCKTVLDGAEVDYKYGSSWL